MCESTVYIHQKNGQKMTFMEDVAKITFGDEEVVCVNILGERKVIRNATLKEANLVNHAILFEEC